MIQLSELVKTFPHGAHPVLDGVTLTIEKGEIFGIVGRSGAGKSTLLRTINGLIKPDCGKVEINGQNITQATAKTLRSYRHRIGMVFQHFNLLASRNVFENIALPLELQKTPRQHIQQRVKQLLTFVEMEDYASYKPAQLSGGQKQRVAIARALATEPSVLLCDEATSALDPETTGTILQLLKRINEALQLTIVLITHEMDVVKQICDRVAIVSAGKIIEQGGVYQIFTQPQSAITKALVQKSLHMELPQSIQQGMQPEMATGLHPIVRLAFVGDSAKTPITTVCYKKFKVAVNILLADLTLIHGASAGFMVCQLIGETDAISQATLYLQTQQIQVEVLGYAA